LSQDPRRPHSPAQSIAVLPDLIFVKQNVTSTRAPEPVGAFPHAKRVGNLLFLSGIGPRKRGSKEIPGVTLDSAGNVLSYDIEAQCHAVFENVRLVLEDAGASWHDIVDVTVFLTNMKKDFPIYNRIYAEYFAGEGKPNPARTTIEVGALPTPIAIELKVIAAVR
jgi:2-aminomuconate deaminase